jgi:MFS family permease
VSHDTLTPKRRLQRALPFDAALLRGGLGRYLFATLLSAFGSGFTFALFVLYCSHLRHVPQIEAGLILTFEAILGIAISPVYGTLTDWYGPSRVLTWCLPVASVAIGSMGFAPSLLWILVVMTVLALSSAGMWSARTVVLAGGAVAGGLGVTTMRRVLTAEQDSRVPAPTRRHACYWYSKYAAIVCGDAPVEFDTTT